MAKPWIHAESSARRWGGKPQDYIEIHDFMDSSKSAFPDNRHRALTHNSWFIWIVERVFGHNIEVDLGLCDNGPCDKCGQTGYSTRLVSVRDICEQHILEDFGNKFIPSPQDYLENMEYMGWMNNGVSTTSFPTSYKKIQAKQTTTKRRVAFRLD